MADTGTELAGTAALQRRTMRVLAVTQVVGMIGVGVAPSIGVLLAGDVTNSEAWGGLARTASTLGAALLGLPLGILAARHGRRFALAAGWWTAALGSAILVAAAQLSAVLPLFVGLLLIGAGSAAGLQSRFAATDLAEPHHRARALSLIVWIGTLGSVLGPNLGAPGEVVSDATGLTVYASAFLIAAVCLALAGAIVFVWLRPDPLLASPTRLHADADPTRASSVRERLARLGEAVRSSAAARYAVIAVLTSQAVMVAVMTMTPVHIVHHGGSLTVVGITISLHVAGMYALAPVVGALVDLRGHRLTIGIGIAILAVSLLLGATLSTSMRWTTVSLILLGVGWSFVNVAGSALFSSSIASESRASAQGALDASSNLTGAATAFLAGPLLAASGFAMLSWVSLVVLVPLAVLTAYRSHTSPR
ncbi:MFS transporter [Demequina gelatinilytica]|uniref:MFS transporter n=1 Tax=Demequina gelatinilytica TaxID=1638980 RepID=UPI000A6DC3EC|nr:MFS transporter [Demequina gelatinilytica]